MRTCSRIRPDRSASCSANASGAFRDPGQSTTSRTPPRISSSTTTRACVVEGFTPTGCHRPQTARRTWTERGLLGLDRRISRNKSTLGIKKLQHRGVDGLRPLQEPEMTGVGYLEKTAAGNRVGDLSTQ